MLKYHLNEENLNEEQEERMGVGWRESHCMQRNACGNPELMEGCCT